MSFWAELRRRNVFRVATTYAIVGWLIIQVVSELVPALKLPEYLNTVFAVALLLGFPVALVLAWVYDVTPDGIVRTGSTERSQEDQLRTVRRLNLVIVFGLAAVAGLMLWQRYDPPSTGLLVREGTIAVLPFEDLSPEGDQRYFADGVSEEILNALARQSDLTVTGRTSSFLFRESPRTLQEIGDVLNVAVLLEGSVRKQDDSVRIVARLIRSRDGAMIWNETFDARLDDIFAVQERVAEGVIDTLAAPSDPDAFDRGRRFSFDAYDDFLRARELVAMRTPDAVEEAEALLESVHTRAPDYAPPLAMLALVERLMAATPGSIGDRPVAQSTRRAIEYAERALTLDPALADAHAVRGLLYLDEKALLKAELELRQALELNPSLTNARMWLGTCLMGKQKYQDAVEQAALLLEREPMFAPSAHNLSIVALGTGDPERVEQVIARLERIGVARNWIALIQARLYEYEGDIARAITLMNEEGGNLTASGTLQAALAQMLLAIGDTQRAAAVQLPFTGIRAALLEGNAGGAVTEAEALLEASDHFYVFQIEYLRTLALAGRDDTLLAYLDSRIGDLDAFERKLYWGYDVQLAPYWTIAYALHRSGENRRLEAVLARWRRAIDVSRANGADNLDLHANEARWRALSGDREGAIAALDRAGARAQGLLGARFRIDYLNELLGGETKYQALMNRNLERINVERAALDLPPLKP